MEPIITAVTLMQNKKILDEENFEITIDDLGSGPFLILSGANTEDSRKQSIAFTIEEWEEIKKEVDLMASTIRRLDESKAPHQKKEKWLQDIKRIIKNSDPKTEYDYIQIHIINNVPENWIVNLWCESTHQLLVHCKWIKNGWKMLNNCKNGFQYYNPIKVNQIPTGWIGMAFSDKNEIFNIWHPIQIAPKDGTSVQLWSMNNCDEYLVDCKWDKNGGWIVKDSVSGDYRSIKKIIGQSPTHFRLI